MKKIARKSESGTSLNFTIKRNTSYLVFILFSRVKLTSMFTHVKITRQWKSTLKDKTRWTCIFDVYATHNFSLALSQAAR